MLKAKSISCSFLPHEVPAAGDLTENLSISAMFHKRHILVVVELDVLPLLITEVLPAVFANRPIICLVAVVATHRGHGD